MVSMGIGRGFYKNVPEEEFENFVQTCAETHAEHFDKKFVCCKDFYSPLSAIFGPNCMEDDWSQEQIEQAKIVFSIYKNYEPTIPKDLTSRSGSLLHAVFRA